MYPLKDNLGGLEPHSGTRVTGGWEWVTWGVLGGCSRLLRLKGGNRQPDQILTQGITGVHNLSLSMGPITIISLDSSLQYCVDCSHDRRSQALNRHQFKHTNGRRRPLSTALPNQRLTCKHRVRCLDGNDHLASNGCMDC